MATFPKPWELMETGPGGEYCIFDAAGRKLFYIISDEGDDAIPESVLYYGTEEEHDALIAELLRLLKAPD